MKSSISFVEYNTTGDSTIIIIHNAGGNNNFTRKQAEFLGELGYHVINVDLPGHGSSDQSLRGYNIEVFADEIISLCKIEGIMQAIIIGLNYGACIGTEIAYREPVLISHLVLLDPPVLMEHWVQELIRAHIKELTNGYIGNFGEKLINEVLISDNKEDRELAIASFNQISKDVLVSIYENLLVWDRESGNKFKNIKCPILHIQSQYPFCSEDALKAVCSQVVTLQVMGTGHWMTMEVPEQINEMIKCFLEKRL